MYCIPTIEERGFPCCLRAIAGLSMGGGVSPSPYAGATLAVASISSMLQIVNGSLCWNCVASIPAELSLFSATGRLVERIAVQSPRGQISLSGLPPGTYYADFGGKAGLNSAVRMAIVR